MNGIQNELRAGIEVELSAQLLEVLTRRLLGHGDRRELEGHEQNLRRQLQELREAKGCAA